MKEEKCLRPIPPDGYVKFRNIGSTCYSHVCPNCGLIGFPNWMNEMAIWQDPSFQKQLEKLEKQGKDIFYTHKKGQMNLRKFKGVPIRDHWSRSAVGFFECCNAPAMHDFGGNCDFQDWHYFFKPTACKDIDILKKVKKIEDIFNKNQKSVRLHQSCKTGYTPDPETGNRCISGRYKIKKHKRKYKIFDTKKKKFFPSFKDICDKKTKPDDLLISKKDNAVAFVNRMNYNEVHK